MSKKQNPEAIYCEFDKATQDLAAWAILNKGEIVAKVVRKTGGRSSPHGLTVRAYVHVLGLPMVRGIARGGGYDMTSEAVLQASKMLPTEKRSHIAGIGAVCITGSEAQAVTSFRAIKDSGETWAGQLRAMGYTVEQVV